MSAGERVTPFGSRSPGSPVSLKSPESDDPDVRAVIPTTTDPVDPPDNTLAIAARKALGFSTRGRRWLHVTVLVETATDTTWSLYLWNEVSALWCLDTRVGTAGVETVALADADNPQASIIEIAGTDRVYVAVTPGAGANVTVWLATSGTVDAG